MIVSDGKLATIDRLVLSDTSPTYARSFSYPTQGLSLTAQFASYAAIYRAQLMVFSLVNKLAYNTARLPLKVYERNGADGRTEARDTPFAKLLRKPNPRMGPKFFWLWTASTYWIYGEALWAKVRGLNGQPAELWPLHPANVFIRQEENGDLNYVFHLGASSQPVYVIPSTDIVHFKTYNPDTTLRGVSPLEALRMTLVNEDAARRASAGFWKNGARPSTVLSHPKTLSKPVMDRLRDEWSALHAGVDNFGGTAILEEGMKPEPLSLSAEESQYIESRRLNQEETCIAYDLSPIAMHILTHATYSNVTEGLRSVYRDTMAPRLEVFEDTVDTSLRPDFDDTGVTYAEFLMDEVMRGAFEDRAAANQAAINSGQRTPNEIRALDNEPPLPGGDQLLINSTLVPLVAAEAKATAELEAAAGAQRPFTQPPVKALAAAAYRMTMGRVSGAETLGDIDLSALTAGLNGSTDTVKSLYSQARADGDTVERFKELIRAAALEGVAT